MRKRVFLKAIQISQEEASIDNDFSLPRIFYNIFRRRYLNVIFQTLPHKINSILSLRKNIPLEFTEVHVSKTKHIIL